MANAALMSAIRTRLHLAADPARAAGAQAYLKSGMPSLGVRVPEVRRIVRAAAELPPVPCRNCRPPCWRCGGKPAGGRNAMRPSTSRACGWPLVSGACFRSTRKSSAAARGGIWWTASRTGFASCCRATGRTCPSCFAAGARTRTWIRRAAITAQLGAKSATDPALLAAVVEPNLADPEFFIRKAIGWALRDFAATDPEWVRDFVARHGGALSPLSPGRPCEKSRDWRKSDDQELR